MQPTIRSILAAAAAGILLAAAPALAEEIKFSADLTGKAETPPNDSAGSGKADVAYDTDAKTLSWTIEYSGLSGEATAAHFHGPAAEGQKADPTVPIEGTLTSPVAGTATLTDQQATELQSGLWYFNVHTAKFPGGEIRGQLKKQ